MTSSSNLAHAPGSATQYIEKIHAISNLRLHSRIVQGGMQDFVVLRSSFSCVWLFSSSGSLRSSSAASNTVALGNATSTSSCPAPIPTLSLTQMYTNVTIVMLPVLAGENVQGCLPDADPLP